MPLAKLCLRPNKKILLFPVTRPTLVKKLRPPKKIMRDFDQKRVNGQFCWINLISSRTIRMGNKPKY